MFDGRYGAFASSALTSVTIPGSVQDWGINTFANCKSLIEIIVGEGVTILPTGLLSFCKNLQKVELPSTLKTIQAAFYDTGLTVINFLPDGLEYITSMAFGSEIITKVIIPASVTKIDSLAFIIPSTAIIYCRAKTQPSGWDESWNNNDCTVEWEYTGN